MFGFSKKSAPVKRLISIIDDVSKLRQLVAKGLEAAGFDVIASASGFQGLAQLEGICSSGGTLPDLIVLDMMMPGLSGVETLEAIRSRWAISLIMLTARDEPSVKMKACGKGADDCLKKPFLMDELEARIRAGLRRTGRDPGVPRSSVLTNGELRLDPDAWTVSWKGSLQAASP